MKDITTMALPISPRGWDSKLTTSNAHSHPFGRENEVSVRQLFKFFCNNLYLGQWELARASVKELHQQKELLGISIRDILEDVIQNPYGYSLGNDNILTPHHLSWLCLQEFLNITNGQEDVEKQVDIKHLKQDVEYRLLLVEASDYLKEGTVNELYLSYKELCSHNKLRPRATGSDGADVTGSSVNSASLSTSCKELLRRLLLSDPPLGHAVIEQLISAGADNLENSLQKGPHHEQLVAVHLECLDLALEQVRRTVGRHVRKSDSDESFSLSLNDETSIHNHSTVPSPPATEADSDKSLRVAIKQLLQHLALFDAGPEMSRLPLRSFFEQLCLVLPTTGGLLRPEAVYSALLGRHSTYLLELFSDVEHQVKMRQRQACTEDTDSFEKSCLLSDVGHQILSLCEETDRRQAWKHLTITSIKHEKHFLDLIMETAMCLVKSSQFERLSAMLSKEELQPLRHLVLLVGWDHCTDVDAAKRLLQALGETKGNSSDGSVLEQACQRLSHQVSLVQWCLDQTSSLVEPSDASASSQQASLLLRGLETHSVLHMLHRSGRLTQLGHTQVVRILSERPQMSASSGDDGQKKEKTVRFAVDSEDQTQQDGQDVLSKPAVHVEMERDLALYRSYCALRTFMEAVHFCADTVNWESYVSAHSRLAAINRRQIRTVLQGRICRQSSSESPLSGSGSFSSRSRSVSSQSGSAGNPSGRSGSIGNRPSVGPLGGRYMRPGTKVSATGGPLPDTFSSEDPLNRIEEAQLALAEFQTIYEEQVIARLKQGREFLADLHPLKLRIETLENIFSLLFLTNADLHEEMLAGHSDSGEEGAIPESRGGSRGGSHGGSNDNLSVLETTTEETPKAGGSSPATSSERLSFDQQTQYSQSTIKETKAASSTDLDTQGPISPEIPRKTKSTPVGLFSISTVELKDTSSDLPKRTSGNQSTNSAGSTSSIYRIGFVANPYLVRDLLAVLKDCLGDLSTAKYRLAGQQPPTREPSGGPRSSSSSATSVMDLNYLRAREEVLNRHVVSSVDQLQQRMSRLSQCVSEASWRFQLVAPSQLPVEVGKISTTHPVTDVQSGNESDIAFHSDDEFDRLNMHRKRKKSVLRDVRTPDELDGKFRYRKLTTASTTDDSTASSSSHSVRRRRRQQKQQQQRRRQQSGRFLLLGREGIVPLMLSDSHTLLNVCLQNAKFSQAHQVVKMFGMERSRSAAEVQFAEHYAVAVRTLQNLSDKAPSVNSAAQPSTRPPRPGLLSIGRPSVSAVANVAAAGLVTVSATTTVDRLLSLDAPPAFSPELLEAVAASASPLARFVDPALVPAMVIADLICVASHSYDSTCHLMEMMSKRCPRQEQEQSFRVKSSRTPEENDGKTVSSSSPSSSRSGSSLPSSSSSSATPRGVHAFLELLFQYVQLARSELDADIAGQHLCQGLNDALLTATRPLLGSDRLVHARCMVELDRALQRTRKATQEARTQETLSLVQTVRAGHQGEPGKVPPSCGQREKPVVRQALKHLIAVMGKHVPPGGLADFVLKLKSGDRPPTNNYLQHLYDHVKALSCLVHECDGDKMMSSTIEYFHMLDEGPTQILGKLIFVKKIPPARLEDVAKKLHVNMLQIIINNCCPRVSCLPSPPPPIALDEEEVGGKLVLNPSNGWVGSVQHPNTVVTEILTRFIGLLKEYGELDSASGIFTPSLMTSVVQDLLYYQLTAATVQLKYIDLRLLDSREDRLCFYGNLVNLMTLHVLLRQVQKRVEQLEVANRSRLSAVTLSRQSSVASPTSPGASSGLQQTTFGDGLDGALPNTALDWLLLQTRMAYHVGQLGVISLFELRYFVLRNGLPAPSSYNEIVKDRCHELDPLDPWSIYGPEPEPRMLFVLSEGHVSSPPLQILSREMVLNQLRTAMKEYLHRTITVHEEFSTVVLPQWLIWHQVDFASNYRQVQRAMPYEALLNLLSTQLESPLVDALQRVMDQHTSFAYEEGRQKTGTVNIRVSPYSLEHTYVFDFEQFSRLNASSTGTTLETGSTTHRRCASLPWTPGQARPATAATMPGQTLIVPQPSDVTSSQTMFHLTPAGLTYLRSHSELTATLASVVGLIDKVDLLRDLKTEEEVERSKSPTVDKWNTGEEKLTTRHSHTDGPARNGQQSPRAGSPEGKASPSRKSPSRPVSLPGQSKPRQELKARRLSHGSIPEDRCSSTSPPLTTIAEYRYHHLLEEFPTLWRHIFQQVVPLEAAQDPDLAALQGEENQQQLARVLCNRELNGRIRTAALVSPNNQQLADSVLTLAKLVVEKQDWLAAVHLLQAMPDLLLRSYPELLALHDFACCCVGHTSGESLDISDTDSNDLWRHLLAVIDPTTRGRAVLSMTQFWPVEVAVELLEVCVHGERPADDTLCAVLEKRLQETKIYQRITECAKTLQSKAALNDSLPDVTSVSEDDSSDNDSTGNRGDDDDAAITMTAGELTSATLERLCAWQNVVSDSSRLPERVLRVMLDSQEFDIARRWVKGLAGPPRPDLRQTIEEHYITSLLESPAPNHALAFQVLEKELSLGADECLQLCNNLLEGLTTRTNTSFVASFILRHLDDHINKYRKEELRLLVIGCKMLLCLPESAHSIYDHLVSAPMLLLEQLLMNTKVDWLGKILTMLQTIRASPSDTFPSSFDIIDIDALLIKYATKALEFPILHVEQEGSGMVRSESRTSVMSQTSNASALSHTMPSGGPLGVPVATPTRLPHSHSSSALSSHRAPSIKSPSPSPAPNSTPQAATTRTSPIPASGLTGSRTASSLRQPTMYGTPHMPTPVATGAAVPSGAGFIMPPEPPAREQWVPDASAAVCMVCGMERFSMFVRRHHCRRCGRVVCAACSGRTMMIRGSSARTCDQCYAFCFRSKDAEDQGRLHRLKERLSGASSTGSATIGQAVLSPLQGEQIAPSVTFFTDHEHILLTDDEMQNEAQREEFYYDQAPSTSLCLSLMELLSSARECGQVMLRLCDDVSRHLQPLAPGVRNQEVDYGLVISMMKYMLFNAKIKFLKAGDNQGVAQCDVYLGRLDLLTQLVAANCSYIPSMQQLTKIDSLRRLRDRLIEEERLPLAMNVSTKCGIDPAGVWAAWGMAALRAGDYPTARQKFARCLKLPVDNNASLQSTNLLNDIIEQLERVPSVGSSSSPISHYSIKELIAEPQSSAHSESSSREEAVTTECLFYLTNYGTLTSLLSYYLRHNQLQKAVHCVLEKRCSREVFVEGLVVPSLMAGKISRLYDSMQVADPTLERWTHYIIATCRHLDKNKLINTLYSTQLFVKDFIRAAMTCITYFYQQGARTYSDLFSRTQHLLNAKHHLESYLSERQWGNQLRTGSSWSAGSPGWGRRGSQVEGATLRLIMTPTEVNKYVNTISLQMDVTKFLHRYCDNLEIVSSNLRSVAMASSTQQPGGGASASARVSAADSLRALAGSTPPPTLFGSTKMKADVANLVLLSGNNVNDGFGLAFRIIQDFKLDATFIYSQAGRYFSRLRKHASVHQLLSCIRDSGLCTDQGFDDVISACVRVIADDPAESKEIEALIKMIRSDAGKINAYVLCGKLRSAYLIAVKGERVVDIQRIGAIAERSGQGAVKKICDKWLANRQQMQEVMTSKK